MCGSLDLKPPHAAGQAWRCLGARPPGAGAGWGKAGPSASRALLRCGRPSTLMMPRRTSSSLALVEHLRLRGDLIGGFLIPLRSPNGKIDFFGDRARSAGLGKSVDGCASLIGFRANRRRD